MRNNDLVGLYEAYNTIGRQQYLDNKRMLLERELDNLILTEGWGDTLANMGSQAYNATAGAVGKAAGAISGGVESAAKTAENIAQLPQQLQQYFNSDLPQYIDKFTEFLKIALISGAGGAVVVQIIGRLLLMFSKKLQKDGEQTKEIIMSMLPGEVAEKVKAVEHLKNTNPTEYKKQVFLINKNALKELEKTLNGTAKKAGSAILQKVIQFFGEVLSSLPGSLLGGVVIAYLISKLGFNPLPIFPSFPSN